MEDKRINEKESLYIITSMIARTPDFDNFWRLILDGC